MASLDHLLTLMHFIFANTFRLWQETLASRPKCILIDSSSAKRKTWCSLYNITTYSISAFRWMRFNSPAIKKGVIIIRWPCTIWSSLNDQCQLSTTQQCQLLNAHRNNSHNNNVTYKFVITGLSIMQQNHTVKLDRKMIYAISPSYQEWDY